MDKNIVKMFGQVHEQDDWWWLKMNLKLNIKINNEDIVRFIRQIGHAFRLEPYETRRRRSEEEAGGS